MANVTEAPLKFLVYEIEIPCEKHGVFHTPTNEIDTLHSSLRRLLNVSVSDQATQPPNLREPRGKEETTVSHLPNSIHVSSEATKSPPRVNRPASRTFGLELTIQKAPGRDPPSSSKVQLRRFAPRDPHHINYPVIPRWRDRAHLRRMQRQLQSDLPNDLPLWSVRAHVPTTPQPDWSEEGGWLLYDGFSTELFFTYCKELEKKNVPLIPLPYSDEDMKRALVQKGLLAPEEVETLMIHGPESWRGPMEYQEDTKHKKQIEKIENA